MKQVFTLIIITFFIVLSIQSQSIAKVQSFTLRNLDGDLVKLNDYLGKKVIVLDFWATWCKPCVKSLPKIEKLYKTLKDKGVVILGINVDGPRSLSKVEPFANSLGLTFPILFDENRDVVRKYQVNGFPTTIVIGKNKEIVYTINGYLPGDDKKLKMKIIKLLQEK